MSKEIYLGNNGSNKQATAIYVRINNANKSVKNIYTNINGTNKLVYPAEISNLFCYACGCIKEKGSPTMDPLWGGGYLFSFYLDHSYEHTGKNGQYWWTVEPHPKSATYNLTMEVSPEAYPAVEDYFRCYTWSNKQQTKNYITHEKYNQRTTEHTFFYNNLKGRLITYIQREEGRGNIYATINATDEKGIAIPVIFQS